MTNIYKISELSEYIKNIIGNQKIKVIGEVCQPKLSNGHLYFSLKDELSNIKSIIWKSKNINKNEIIEGQQITVDCKLDYFCGNNSVSLVIDKIITNEGQGELYIKYENIKNEFMNKGYFDKSRKKELPLMLKNILVITSENGAALQDFKINLINNNSNVNLTIQDVIVQGIDCPRNICDLLYNLKNNNIIYDLVIITRGGGSFSDLFGFSQPELIEAVYNFNLPILSAIGHQIDNPLLDLVADINTPTPSLAAQYIVDHNKKYLQLLNNKLDKIKNIILDEIINKQKMLSKINEKLYKLFNNIKEQYNIKNKLIQDINNYVMKLSLLNSKLDNNDIISLYYKGNKINNNTELDNYIGKNIKLIWGNIEYKIKILE